jgi:4-hydroxybenzoate polyprenyltransferase
MGETDRGSFISDRRLLPSRRMHEAHQEALAATATVLVFFAVATLRNAPETFPAIVAIAVLAVVLDLVWKRIRPEQPAEASPVQST